MLALVYNSVAQKNSEDMKFLTQNRNDPKARILTFPGPQRNEEEFESMSFIFILVREEQDRFLLQVDVINSDLDGIMLCAMHLVTCFKCQTLLLRRDACLEATGTTTVRLVAQR